MKYLAHSAKREKGIPAQEYGDHIQASRRLARRYSEKCGRFSPIFGKALTAAATLAGEFHDLGKLDELNQEVLAGNSGKKLPVPHVDSAAAYLLKQRDQASMFAALVCYSHHRGLPSLPQEINRSEHWMRDSSAEWRTHTELHLDEYLHRHHQCVPPAEQPQSPKLDTNRLNLLWRLALSCQADADHGDTARHYGAPATGDPPLVRAKERLAALDKYVLGLGQTSDSGSRTQLRRDIYLSCRETTTKPSLNACDAPVGSGKTTAVMAHLLQAASDKGLRQIFVVLPYTNIIAQAVEIYRKALVLEGEAPSQVVVEHHHRAEYSDPISRQLTMLWNAPIVVTTAVQFFETLAACMPAALRKLHRLPGSAVFVDEAHAALPAHLWPQTWLWLNELATDWGCHFVFASGSLTRFWELADFHPSAAMPNACAQELPELVRIETHAFAHSRERQRILYKTEPEPFDLSGLTNWLVKFDGPRIIVMNTVQSAAVVARKLEARFGIERVEHLSTALTPADRETTLHRIKQRLLDKSSDPGWALVATSCVEAGVDFSFRIGFRERASLMSLIQLGGRVNRGHDVDFAQVWDFQIKPDNLLRLHPKLKIPARILSDLFSERKVSPQ
ncbi:MAG: CRISPR-associated helicase/endonuclease Cas3, partial [Pyrinomonadaceae bacterium]